MRCFKYGYGTTENTAMEISSGAGDLATGHHGARGGVQYRNFLSKLNR